MSDQRLPCQEGDPDDWFIGRDGKQYPDDELVTSEEIEAHLAEVDPEGALTAEERDRVVDRLEADAKTAALRRRRHAKEACLTCPLRLRCLSLALEAPVQPHGTWGGYYEEEIREIRREIARRKRREA